MRRIWHKRQSSPFWQKLSAGQSTMERDRAPGNWFAWTVKRPSPPGAGLPCRAVRDAGTVRTYGRKKMDDNTLLLGEIKGKLEALTRTVDGVDGKLDALSVRVGRLEIRSATHGAVAGGIVSVGMAILLEKIKRTMGM